MSFLAILESDGTTSFERPDSNVRFSMPALPEGITEQADVVVAFHEGLDSLGRLIEQTETITKDKELSEIGRRARLEPMQRAAIERIALAGAKLVESESRIAAREQEVFGVPVIEGTNAVQALADWEVRDNTKSLKPGELLKQLAHIADKPSSASKPMLAALKRAPIPLSGPEADLLDRAWRACVTLEQPHLAEQFRLARSANGWAERGMKNVVGLMGGALKWDSKSVLRMLVTSRDSNAIKGAAVFGYSAADVEHMRHMVALGRG